MTIKKIFRDLDVVNQKKDLEHLYTFKKFPIFMGVSNKKKSSDKYFDMKWHISKSTGMIQLNPLLPLNVLYPESHNSGCIGKLWDEHHKSFATFMKKFKPKNVLEIGAAHGRLCKEFSKLTNKVKWTIIEPNPIIEKGVKAKIIKGFFDQKFSPKKNIDTFVHSHVFEHIYHLHEFMNDLGNKIDIKKKLIFSIPNLEIMLKKKYTNCINFEHTIFLTEPFIRFFLKKYGFKIVEKKFFKKDHSIFYSCIKFKETNKNSIFNGNFYKKYKSIYLNYIKYHKKLIFDLNRKIIKSKKPIFLFGAHVFSQYLISFGLRSKKILYILDNDKKKQNKRLYGTNLTVKSPKILSKYKNPLVILKVGVYFNEIKNDITKNINHKTKFL